MEQELIPHHIYLFRSVRLLQLRLPFFSPLPQLGNDIEGSFSRRATVRGALAANVSRGVMSLIFQAYHPKLELLYITYNAIFSVTINLFLSIFFIILFTLSFLRNTFALSFPIFFTRFLVLSSAAATASTIAWKYGIGRLRRLSFPFYG